MPCGPRSSLRVTSAAWIADEEPTWAGPANEAGQRNTAGIHGVFRKADVGLPPGFSVVLLTYILVTQGLPYLITTICRPHVLRMTRMTRLQSWIRSISNYYNVRNI